MKSKSDLAAETLGPMKLKLRKEGDIEQNDESGREKIACQQDPG
jgi:hypothetical protein